MKLQTFSQFSGFGASTNFDSLAAVSDRFYLDISDSHAHHGRSFKVDLLGCSSEFLTQTGNNRLHDHSRLFCWTNERRESNLSIQLANLMISFFQSVHMSQRHAMHVELHNRGSRSARSRQPSTLRTSTIYFALCGFRFHLRVNIFEVRKSCDTF